MMRLAQRLSRLESLELENPMPELHRRLAKLERNASGLLNDTCPACQGRTVLAFEDEPGNTGSRYPFDAPGGACRLCRQMPERTIIPLSPVVRKAFAALPFSDSPATRYADKVALLVAVYVRCDLPDPHRGRFEAIANRMQVGTVEQQLNKIYARAGVPC